jgi:UDPglucose 6-dehydrogenase
VSRLPEALQDRIRLASSPLDAVDGAAALVVATSWPQYREVDAGDVRARMAGALVLDANRYLAATIGQHAGLTYVSVGKGGS